MLLTHYISQKRHPLTSPIVSDVSYEDIPVTIESYRTRLSDLQNEKADLSLTLYCSQRLIFKQDNTITLRGKKLNLDYSHTQTDATTRMFTDKLEYLEFNIRYVQSAIRALQEFQRHRLALDTVDDMFRRASETDIQETIDKCELELKGMVKRTSSTVNKSWLMQKNPFANERVGEVMTKVEAQTEAKRTVLDKMKGLLVRGRSSSRGLYYE